MSGRLRRPQHGRESAAGGGERRRRPRVSGCSLALLGVLLAGSPLLPAREHGPHEYLDEETAATVTLVGDPLVFAQPRTDLAANARDYANVLAASVNRNGKTSYVLIVYFWSTVDKRLHGERLPGPDELILQADDRRIRLPLSARSAHEAGIGGRVDAPDGSDAPPYVYATDLATMRFIGESRHLALLLETETTTLSYGIWEDGRKSLRAFVRYLSGED